MNTSQRLNAFIENIYTGIVQDGLSTGIAMAAIAHAQSFHDVLCIGVGAGLLATVGASVHEACIKPPVYYKRLDLDN